MGYDGALEQKNSLRQAEHVDEPGARAPAARVRGDRWCSVVPCVWVCGMRHAVCGLWCVCVCGV